MEKDNEILISGRYRIIKKIATGGMADIYLGDDLELKRKVAVQVLSANYAGDRNFVARFRREAQVLAGLNHPNIIFLKGVSVDGKYPALVLERLHHTLYRKRNTLSNSRIKSIMHQLLLAVNYVHKRGLIHGDIKTSNILLVPGVKLIDFGLVEVGPMRPNPIYTLNYRAP